jgi:hypothetical protein
MKPASLLALEGPEPAFRDWRHETLAFFDFLPTRLNNGFVEDKNNVSKPL